MAGRNPQTQAKRARELALREKRERKQVKKADAAAAKKAGDDAPDGEAAAEQIDTDEPERLA